MERSNRRISYNRKEKLWELRSLENPTAIEFVKTKSQATKWLNGEIGDGNCYEVSAKIVLDIKESNKYSNLKLCHGTVHGQGPLQGAIFGHSWVEYEQTLPINKKFKEHFPNAPSPSLTIVLDKSNNKNLEIPAPIYYLTGKIDPNKVTKYTLDQVRENIIKHGHWGPWEL